MSRKNSVGSIADSLGEKDRKFDCSTPEDCIPEIPMLEGEIPIIKERRGSTMSSSSSISESKSGWKSFVDASQELGNDSKKLYKFIKRRFSSKKKKRETEVKAIHIVPDEEENSKWASRSATSAHSRTSTDTASSSAESRDGIQTVHDMDDEYNVFHGC